MSVKSELLNRVKIKLVNLPLSVNLTLGVDELDDPLYDAMREMSISDVTNVTDGSKDELYLELRTQYYALAMIRNEVSSYFKWSSGSDGKDVDKTKVFDKIDTIMKDLDEQFENGYFKNNSSKTLSGIYTKSLREKKRLL